MKIQYWGTAAAEGIPSVFCDCEVCRAAREKGGRFMRARAQALIDDELLVDFGPDTYHSSLKWGYNLAELGYVLITHTHEDHFTPSELHNRQVGFSYGMKHETLEFYGSTDMVEQYYHYMAGQGAYLLEQKRVGLNVIEPYKTAEIDGYSVTPLPATHGTRRPYVYIIEKNGKTIFYLNDTGYPKPEALDWLSKCGKKFDLVSYDCTHGDMDPYKEWGENASHMGLKRNIILRDKLRGMGLYKPETVDIVTHFSHNGVSVGYDDITRAAKENGFIAAYDGMIVEI